MAHRCIGFVVVFFILKDPIFNFRKFNSRSSHWYIILFSSSFQYLKRKLIPRLNLNNRRGERNLTDFDEVLGHIQVTLIYVHTLLCVCVWGEKERKYFKNACNFFCIYSKCVCVLFLLSEWNEIKTRYKHIWCVFFDWKLSMGALFEGKVDFNSLHLLRIFLLGYTQLQVQKECEKMYNVFLFLLEN